MTPSAEGIPFPVGIVRLLRARFDMRWFMAAVLCTLSVLTLTHLPQDPTPEVLRQGFFHIDKVEHIFAYGVMTFLFVFALRKPSRLPVFMLVLIGVATVGLVDELTQPLVGRVCGATDYIANVIGILMCGLISARSVLLRSG